jgi:hypothetical protein
MSQHAGSADDEGIQLTYSSLLAGKRSQTPPTVLPHDGGPAPGEPGAVRGSRGAWPHPYHRVLNTASLGALFAVGVLLGTVMSGDAAPRRSQSMVSRPGVTTTLALHTGTVGAAPVTTAPDAHFAILTLGIRCLRDLCDATQYVPAGQRVYALQGGGSCTTMNAFMVVGYNAQYVYCRLDQPNVFTTTFDGAPFDCVGSRLGCRFVVQVETTSSR